jgi:hypothetical protein
MRYKGNRSVEDKLLAIERLCSCLSSSPTRSVLSAGETNRDGHYKVSGTIAKSEGTREGQLEVLADHSTDGQRE